MNAGSGPTPPSERVVALDALRGFALLGILVINIRVFSMPEPVLANPTLHGDLTGANYWAWLVGHVFAELKFLTLFTVLFGGSIILFTRSAERKGRSARALYRRRTGWLLLFGLAHAYLLWYGDILFLYGVCGLVVVGLRGYPPRQLAVFGAALLAIPSLLEVLTGLISDPATVAGTWQPSASALRAEIVAYRGGWLDQMTHRFPTAFRRQTVGLVGGAGWRVAGSMLFGMALFKWGVLTNDRPPRFYRRLVWVGAVAGIAPILAGVWYINSHDWGIGAALLWRQFNYWGSLPLAGAYIGVVMLYARWRPEGVVTRTLAAVGRTAFSNYILQTVFATSVFYGHGLGLFGRISRVEALGVVAVIWAVQVLLSVLWLRYFRFGPLEWLWRVLTYRSRQPIRRAS